jgi:NADH-quinone oxidoreductase subunit J
MGEGSRKLLQSFWFSGFIFGIQVYLCANSDSIFRIPNSPFRILHFAFENNMILTVFLALSVISIITALLMVVTRNPVHSVLYLILTFFVIAALYILLNAQFLAVVHLIVYAGAIMVLFLFVLMLLNLSKDTEPQKSVAWRWSAAVTAGMLLVVLIGALRSGIQMAEGNPANGQVGLVENLGKVLFTDYVVPFEIAGILFLAAMVGAVLVGKRDLNI